MKTIITVIASCLLIGSSAVFAEGQGAAAGGADAAPTPQLQEQMGQPTISGDGINNATQVEDPSDIGRTGDVPEDAPEPQPLEGDAGVQQAK
jgi:hypothetical protein